MENENPNSESELKAGGETSAAIAPEDESAKPKSKRLKVILIIIALIISVAGTGTFFYLKKKQQAEIEAKLKEEQSAAKPEIIFHDLEEIIVNLNTEGKNVSFMKLKVTFEVDGKNNLDTVIKMSPRIRDVMQVYLRELRPSDLQGSVGLYRLRDEIMLRINKVIYPAQVKDILFKDIVVQ